MIAKKRSLIVYLMPNLYLYLNLLMYIKLIDNIDVNKLFYKKYLSGLMKTKFVEDVSRIALTF
jgi:hypothetical protein